eukprot:TRINITY_DN1333_c0_g3_i3.p2 TRINITY_DN1333_c0_g3~~TRINITY_DN1333_c0_g3_i3.p2  ORF type:complete len:105 (+),score=9.34 TRINITY_DN1333_c0_g3_i3:443-757(+)
MEEREMCNVDKNIKKKDITESTCDFLVIGVIKYALLRKKKKKVLCVDTTAQPQAQPQSGNQYARELEMLSDMGFTNVAFNMNLLNRFNGNVQQVIDYYVTNMYY